MHPVNTIPRIGITLGDPNGIGPEVVIKALTDSRILDTVIPVIYGSTRVLSYYEKWEKLNYKKIEHQESFFSSSVNVVDCAEDPFEIHPGNASETSAKASLLYLKKGVEAIREKKIDGLVTGPIDKNTSYGSTFPYRGHTEYLAHIFNTTSRLMLMVGKNMKIGLMSEHVPLREAAGMITKKQIKLKIHLLEQSLKHDFQIDKPKIAVLGLNPHAGDKGLIGQEENTIINSAIHTLCSEGKSVFGPFSADGFFASKNDKQYDGIMAMYHDQGLIPFKLLEFGEGINYTAGLPIVRTSPDHGTAYEIAGQNKAHENSMKQAIYWAAKIVENRSLHAATKNAS